MQRQRCILVLQLKWAAIGCRCDGFPRATALSWEFVRLARPGGRLKSWRLEVSEERISLPYAGLEVY